MIHSTVGLERRFWKNIEQKNLVSNTGKKIKLSNKMTAVHHCKLWTVMMLSRMRSAGDFQPFIQKLWTMQIYRYLEEMRNWKQTIDATNVDTHYYCTKLKENVLINVFLTPNFKCRHIPATQPLTCAANHEARACPLWNVQ